MAPAAFSVSAASAPAMKAWASARSASSIAAPFPLIAPNDGDHLECDECGQCIDICPVGALTSGAYRYQDAALGNGARRHHLHALLRMAARPRSACATTRSSAATIATAPASTANFSASRAATRSISPITPSACNRPMMRVNGKLEAGLLVARLSPTVAKKFGQNQPRRQVRRHRFQPHHQRRELSICRNSRAQVPRHEQHRSPPHRRCRHAGRCAQRHDRPTRHHADLYERKAFLIIGADLALEQPLPLVPDSRQLAPSRRAHLRRHGRAPCAKTSTRRPSASSRH